MEYKARLTVSFIKNSIFYIVNAKQSNVSAKTCMVNYIMHLIQYLFHPFKADHANICAAFVI